MAASRGVGASKSYRSRLGTVWPGGFFRVRDRRRAAQVIPYRAQLPNPAALTTRGANNDGR